MNIPLFGCLHGQCPKWWAFFWAISHSVHKKYNYSRNYWLDWIVSLVNIFAVESSYWQFGSEHWVDRPNLLFLMYWTFADALCPLWFLVCLKVLTVRMLFSCAPVHWCLIVTRNPVKIRGAHLWRQPGCVLLHECMRWRKFSLTVMDTIVLYLQFSLPFPKCWSFFGLALKSCIDNIAITQPFARLKSFSVTLFVV